MERSETETFHLEWHLNSDKYNQFFNPVFTIFGIIPILCLSLNLKKNRNYMKIILWLVAAIVFFVVLFYVFKFVFFTSLIIAAAILIIPILYFTFKGKSKE